MIDLIFFQNDKIGKPIHEAIHRERRRKYNDLPVVSECSEEASTKTNKVNNHTYRIMTKKRRMCFDTDSQLNECDKCTGTIDLESVNCNCSNDKETSKSEVCIVDVVQQDVSGDDALSKVNISAILFYGCTLRY